ncbi:endonuclease [Nonlabens antarcticus]|uniref:endonuclease n=1 Tax=Nonlabens antarcticus TaxID=392714 RepID=UPI001890C093|nr:endonuclease [Nonlabens antarcticus]
MKKITLIALILISYLGTAQAPTGYYDSAESLSGFQLKTELKAIISNGFNSRTYGDLLTLYATSDNDEYYPGQEGNIDQATTILDIYSENPTGADAYNYTFEQSGASANEEGGGFNREHLYPQGFFNGQELMRNDAHHVVPSDILVNNRRNNYPFGEVGTASYTSSNGSKLGNSITPGYTLIVFEPIDEFKGDVARSLLYFATRYEDNWNDNNWDNFDNERDPRGGPIKGQWYDAWFINLLLKWHAQDPVSTRERDRNNEVYVHQNNRNPFIDNPQYASSIWGDIENIVAVKGDLVGSYVDADNDGNVNVGDQIEYVYSITNAGNKILYNINIASEKGLFETPLQLENLAPGATSTNFSGVLTYTIKQEDIDSSCECVTNQTSFKANTESTNDGSIINGISDDPSISTNVDSDNDSYPDDITVTDLPFPRTGGGGSNDLFISEYIEGSGFNKAIEIANFTGAAVDLSNYSLKRDGNGEGAWIGNAVLEGTLNDGEVYVVINNKADESNIVAQADLVITSTGSAVIDFNGDDPVGLFKNDVLIDIVGTFGVRVEFGKDVTLLRKAEVLGPTTTFDLAGEWNSFTRNTSTDLGMHTYNGEPVITSNDLFISEYIEGSGLNKAIEIANFTGVTVDLSTYSIQRNASGGATYEGAVDLLGSLNDGEVYVIINDGATDSNILAQADLAIPSTGSSAIDFNGNDPVGLFKDDVLIDIVGTFNGGAADFAKDVTLVRKSSVTGPNLNFNLAAEWNSFPRNTSTDLGQHTYGATAGENDKALSLFQVYPNPSKGVFHVKGLLGEAQISIFDVAGRQLSSQKLVNSQFTIENQGIYLVKIQTNTVARVFKVIVE